MYKFEINQYIKIQVSDDDGGNKSELIGEVNTTLGSIVGSKDFLYVAQLIDPKNPTDKSRGELTIKIVPVKETKAEIEMKLACN